MSGVQVRIRNAQTGESHILGRLPFEALENIVLMISRHGLDCDGTFIDTDTLSTQFRVNDNGAYFEVDFK